MGVHSGRFKGWGDMKRALRKTKGGRSPADRKIKPQKKCRRRRGVLEKKGIESALEYIRLEN